MQSTGAQAQAQAQELLSFSGGEVPQASLLKLVCWDGEKKKKRKKKPNYPFDKVPWLGTAHWALFSPEHKDWHIVLGLALDTRHYF